MYIRRKVFSLLNVNGEERYFSTTDFENVSESEVRLFSDNEKAKMSNKKKAAIATAAAVAATTAVIGGGKLAGNKIIKDVNKAIGKTTGTTSGMTEKEYNKLMKQKKVGEYLSKPADVISEGAKGAVEGIKKGWGKASEYSKEAVDKAKKAVEETVTKVKDKMPKKGAEAASK